MNTDLTISDSLNQRLREGLFIVTGTISVFLLMALCSYHAKDPGWSHTTNAHHIANMGGRVGAWFADVFLFIFGYTAYLFPLLLAYGSWVLFRKQRESIAFDWKDFCLRFTGFLGILLSACALISLHIHPAHTSLPLSAGGILGDGISYGVVALLNTVGSTLLLLAIFCASVTLLTGLSWFNVIYYISQYSKHLPGYSKQLIQKIQSLKKPQVIAPKRRTKPRITKPKKEPTLDLTPIVNKIKAKPKAKRRKVKIKPGQPSLPSLELLDESEVVHHDDLTPEALEQLSRAVEATLLDFNVKVTVVAVHPGPVITRFELELAPGVKVSKVSGLAKDIARSLSVISVRIVEVIPGKAVIGLEIPNQTREVVRLREVFTSSQYQQAHSALSLALGKDISGHPVVVDLAKMPHLLVAGTTGSGKSVGLNAMLLSLLYKTTPEEVRLIMVDPKMLELAIYDGIPHLLTPVVTDMKEAANALRWCVAEMERRYRLMAAMGVRNVSGFNQKVQAAIDKGEPIPDPLADPNLEQTPPSLEPLPLIVVLVDEFADMMMVVGKKVEELIARIAQKARAAGIHLILATQRPSVDVITGLIKANVPTRIAFQVSSRVDSRTILDQQGAEQLLGYGDMLYLAPGTGVPVRVHGAFVADDEVHKVVNHLKQQGEPDYLPEIINTSPDMDPNMLLPGEQPAGGEQDPLFDQAVAIVTETRRASISLVQRKCKIGYNRAASILEDMEAAGIVSPMESNGTREVLAPPPPRTD